MANYCLPKANVQDFLDAIKSGKLNVFKLQEMSSDDRRAALGAVVGDFNAKEINTLFEKKLLLKYKSGLYDWIKEVTDLSEPERKTIVDKISGLDERILNPKDEKAFLADLAADKLKTNVSVDEAKEIFDLSKKAKDLQEEWKHDLNVRIPRSDRSSDIYKTRIAYGNALIDLKDKIEEMKPDGRTYLSTLIDVATMPKTVATGILHFSAIGVQAWGMISKKVTWEAFGEQIKYMADEQNYRDLQAYIVSHPDYKFAEAANLGLSDITADLNNREEAIQSHLLQGFNEYIADKSGLPINLLGASSRAFTGFLNYTRFNRFVDLLEAARTVDESSVSVGNQLTKDLASVVNNFTGRSNLGPGNTFANTQAVLNAAFFAPRKLGATIQMFNPVEYLRLYKNGYETGNFTAANAAVGQLTSSIIATGALLYLAQSVGYTVDFNPASQNFLKIQTPSGEKLDVTGGNAIYTRLWARILTGKKISSSGKETTLGEGYRPVTKADLAIQFLRGKLSPAAGILADYLYGQDAIGRPFDVGEEYRDRMEPIFVGSMIDYYRQNPNKSVSDLPVLSALFGVAVESPLPPPTRNGMNIWGQPVSSWYDAAPTELDKALGQVGYVGRFPGKTINGVKLNDDQYTDYIHTSGNIAYGKLSQLLQSEEWNRLSLAQKRQAIQFNVHLADKTAQTYLMMKSLGTSNDIFAQSTKKAMDKLKGNQ